MKVILRYVTTFLIMILIFIVLMVLVCLIPNHAIYNNIKESSKQLCNLGEKKAIKFLGKNDTLFYFTDILMLNITYSVDSNKPFESAIINKKNYNSNITKTVEHMEKDVKADTHYMDIDNGSAVELKDFIDNKVEESFEYARYWHGYLLILRPLLLILNYKQIVIIFKILTMVLTIILSIILLKKSNIKIMLSFILSAILLNMFCLSNCINENICFFISLLASIYILNHREKIKHIYLIFFIVGVITNFFDILTLPIITLGYPLLFYYIDKEEEEIKIKRDIKELLAISFSWGIGYALCWISKWIIADIFFEKEIIKDGLNQVLYRTIGNEISFTLLKYRLQESLSYTFYIILITCLIFLILTLFKFKKKSIVYWIIACIPILWLVILKEHSAEHVFFVSKILVITFFAILVGIFQILKKDKKI